MSRSDLKSSVRVAQSIITIASTSALAITAMIAIALSPTAASAEQYSVQIGAFRDVAPSFTKSAEAVGELYKTKTASGITRIQVGRFASKEEAAIAKAALLGAGYADAFVVRKGVAAARTSPAQKRASTRARGSDSNVVQPSSADRDPLAGVPEDLRDRVVILDGRLHVVDGNQFTPLDQYERPRY